MTDTTQGTPRAASRLGAANGTPMARGRFRMTRARGRPGRIGNLTCYDVLRRVKGIEPSLSAWELAADLAGWLAGLVLCLVTCTRRLPVGYPSCPRVTWLRAREGHAGGT
jgi:hypothetical protein